MANHIDWRDPPVSYELSAEDAPREDRIELPDGSEKVFTGTEKEALDALAYAVYSEAANMTASVPWAKVSGGHKRVVRNATVRLLDFFNKNGSKVSLTKKAATAKAGD